MGKMDEQIVVVPRAALFGENDERAFQGLLTDWENVRTILVNMTLATQLMRRGDAEENPSYKQPIPYIILKRCESDEVFLYERLSGGGETRLHNKLSIGVGGHMQKTFTPETFSYVLVQEAARELAEELLIRRPDGAEILFARDESDPLYNAYGVIGLISDDANEVGRVHIGLLALIELDKSAIVEVREKDQLAGRWVSLTELQKPEVLERLESWSQFALKALEEFGDENLGVASLGNPLCISKRKIWYTDEGSEKLLGFFGK